MTEAALLPDKRRVAAAFSRGAAAYDGVAALQRSVCDGLLAALPGEGAPARWLDLGCGTGYAARRLQARYPQAQGLAVDLAEGMLQHARQVGIEAGFVAGDAEALPLREGCVDLLFSSLALQWCGDFAGVLGEARRVLRPGGVLAFSSLCAGSLGELREAWAAVDGFVHVNRFRGFDDYQRLCAESGLEVLSLQRVAHTLHFPDLRGLTHSLKALGAHNQNPGRREGLGGRARLAALAEAYERLREPAGLPLTYQVVYGVLRR